MSADDLIASLERALAANPDDLALRAHLIRLLIDADRPHDAVPHLRAGFEIDASDPAIVEVSVELLEALGDTLAGPMREQLDRQGHDGAHAAEDAPAPEDPAPGGRRAVTPDGYGAEDFPDTVDELVDEWAQSDPLEEVEFGHMGVAGITLDDVGGLDAVKRQLERSFLAPIRNPELAAAFGKAAGGGLMLWGPPGCGKTFLARATAGEMEANFYNVGLADVLDMWIGSSERNLAAIFETARRNAPCVLFFDEIDALGQKRSHLRVSGATLRGVVNQLLSELDGVGADNDGIFVLAATNHPWDVDEALLRPGRFDRRLLVLPPDPDARQSILDHHLRGKPVEGVDLAGVVAATNGYSGADLALIVEEATEAALAASLESGVVEPITTAAVERALAVVKPSIGPWLETARNHVIYANRSGDYDELERFLRDHDKRT
jgi:SpoVK/Ycf46/Vps4 family AAA+-type ATPase